jgi:3,4-dihydroxy-2-butanone 4-phosphate synthase
MAKSEAPEPPYEQPFTIEVDGKEVQSGIRSYDRAIGMLHDVATAHPGSTVKIFDRDHRHAGTASELRER